MSTIRDEAETLRQANLTAVSDERQRNRDGVRERLQVLVGRRIRAARRNVGLTSDALAKRIGIARGTLSSWENGLVLPDALHLHPLSSAIQMTLDDLLSPIDEMAVSPDPATLPADADETGSLETIAEATVAANESTLDLADLVLALTERVAALERQQSPRRRASG